MNNGREMQSKPVFPGMLLRIIFNDIFRFFEIE